MIFGCANDEQLEWERAEDIKFYEIFLNGLDNNQRNNLYKHYKKYICNISLDNFISFFDWIDSYKDIPNILRTMTK